jgi:hypothetical protein
MICLVELRERKFLFVNEVTGVDDTYGFGERFEGLDVAFESDSFHILDQEEG